MHDLWINEQLDAVRVKFCGFTREEDAVCAMELGADALGFNFYRKSRRGLVIGDALGWIRKLPKRSLFVAVVVNPSLEELREIECSDVFDLVQFHGDEAADFCNSCTLPWIRALPCPPPPRIAHELPAFRAAAWLLDAAAPAGQYGGTGKTADWGSATEFVRSRPREFVWLAGGLAPANVAGAIREVRPHGVDVAGGIESAPGRKCPQKMKAFLEAVSSAQAEVF